MAHKNVIIVFHTHELFLHKHFHFSSPSNVLFRSPETESQQQLFCSAQQLLGAEFSSFLSLLISVAIFRFNFEASAVGPEGTQSVV